MYHQEVALQLTHTSTKVIVGQGYKMDTCSAANQ